MQFFKFFALAALATVSAAAPAAAPADIKGALDTIAAATVKLNGTVTNYNGGLLGLVPITTQSLSLLNIINKGTKTAQASPQLDVTAALEIAGATGTLANDVNDIIDNLIRTKPKFDKLLIVTPIVKSIIQKQQTATASLSKAILSKIPADLASVAAILIQQIDDKFSQGVKAFS